MTEDVEIIVDNEQFLLSDYFLKIYAYNIGLPEPKTSYIAIPYSNVVYDVTEYFGEVTYNQREITISCALMKKTPCWQKIMNEVLNKLHGKACKFRFVSDSEYWYIGRCTVTTNEHSSWNFAELGFSFLCNPFKETEEGVELL